MVMHRKPNTQMGQSIPIKAEVETDQTGELVLIKEEVETDQTQVPVKTEVATYRTAESVPIKTEVQTGESVPINPMVQAALSNENKTGGCIYKGVRMGTERVRLAGYKMQHHNIVFGRDCYFKQSASTAEISLSGTAHPIPHVDNIEIDHVSVKTEPYHENNNAPLSIIQEAKYISAIDVEDNTEHIAYPVRLYRNVHMIAFLAQNALGPVIFEKCVASTDCETSPHTRVTDGQDCLSSEESVGHSSCQQTSTDRKSGKGTVDIHRVAQGSEEPNVRKLYDTIVANPSSLKMHTKTNRAGKGYICIQCDAAFEQSSHLKHHMLTHTGNKLYMHICKQCDIAFESTAMKSHMQTRMGEKRYECYQCDASFTNSSNLKKHIRIHTGEKPYVCKQCNAAFARSYNLTTHMRTHTGDRPYVCKQCDAAFTQSHNLKKHMLTHSGCKAFVCTQCDVAFTQSSRLKRHMLTHSCSKAETTFDDTELHCIADVRNATELNQTPPTHAGNRGTGQIHVKTEHRDDNSHTPLSTVQEAKYISPMDDKDQPEPTVYHVGLDQNIQLTAHLAENVHGPVMSEKCDGEICPHTWVTGGQNTSDCLLSENSVRHNSHQHIAAASDRGGYNTHTSPSSLKIHTQTRKDGGHNTSDSVEHLTHQQTSADRDNNKGTLGAHWMAQGDATPNVCKQYDSVVTNPSSLKLHTWTTKDNKRYTCIQCNAVFGCLSHLDRHIRAHTGDRPYICEQCDAKFTHSTSLKSHMRTHTGVKPYSCKQCDVAFTHSTNLKNHMRTHTGEKPYACKQCGAAFIYSTALKNHVRTHTGEKPYLCKLCDSTFSTSKLLKIHTTRHTGDRRFACEQCGFAFFESCALKKHVQTHTGDKPYTCKLCNAAFTTSSNLKVHMRIHTGDKPFVCKQCNAAFTRSTYLREHIRIHTGDKPFVCKRCSAAFTQASTLNTHMRTHAIYRPFVCKQCDASFRHSRHLESHVQIHMGDKPYVCKQCYAAFTQSRSLKRHMRIHTRAISRVNIECDATVAQSGSLKKHMLTRSCSKTETFDEAGWVPIGSARNATILNQASPTLVDDMESGHVHVKTEYYDANIHTTMSTIQETKVASSIDDEDKPEHTVYPVGLYQNVHVAAHLMENVHGPVVSEKCDARDDTAYPNSCVTGAQNTMQYLGSVCR